MSRHLEGYKVAENGKEELNDYPFELVIGDAIYTIESKDQEDAIVERVGRDYDNVEIAPVFKGGDIALYILNCDVRGENG